MSLKTIWEKIKEWCDDHFCWPCYLNFHAIKEKITGTWDYFWFIWKYDCYREWDYDYLYKLIEFKLQRMAVQLRKDNFVKDSEERYEEIKEALKYLNVFRSIEDGNYNREDVDVLKNICEQQQIAWEKFHDTLKEHGQRWWS